MLREKLDDYLDGTLSAAERAQAEAALARDPAAGKLLSRMRSERALRAAAYESYMPTTHEARSLAERVMAEAHDAPVGRVGYWVRRGAAVAAGLILVAGAFVAGRGSVMPQQKHDDVAVETKTVYDVLYIDSAGTYQQTELSSLEERNDFIAGLQKTGATVVAAEYYPQGPGHM
jgi:anti-sigma factor RsiW